MDKDSESSVEDKNASLNWSHSHFCLLHLAAFSCFFVSDLNSSFKGLTGKQLCQSAWNAAFDAFGVDSDVEDAPLLVVAVGSQADPLDDVVVPKNAKCYPFLPQERCGD